MGSVDSNDSNSDGDEPNDEELEAQAERDKDCDASDEAEIQDLSKEVEDNDWFFVGAADGALGHSALLKVCLLFGLEVAMLV